MAKDILFNIDARDQLKKGVDELANAVRHHRKEIRCSAHHKRRCDCS